MTEPDEALLWARERAKRRFSAPTAASRDICAQIDAGKHDGELEVVDASAYRAGAAASKARIKALEAKVAELERRVPMDGLRCEIGEDGKTMKITIPGRTLLAPLKEADQ